MDGLTKVKLIGSSSHFPIWKTLCDSPSNPKFSLSQGSLTDQNSASILVFSPENEAAITQFVDSFSELSPEQPIEHTILDAKVSFPLFSIPETTEFFNHFFLPENKNLDILFRLLMKKNSTQIKESTLKNTLSNPESLKSYTPKTSLEKSTLTEKLEKILTTQQINPKQISLALTAFEELFMNAITHSRKSFQENFQPEAPSIHAPLTFSKTSLLIEVAFGVNQEWVALEVMDSGGTLIKKELLQKVLGKQNKKAIPVDPSAPSLGIGLLELVSNGWTLFFDCIQGEMTRVQAYYPRNTAFAQRDQTTRALSIRHQL